MKERLLSALLISYIFTFVTLTLFLCTFSSCEKDITVNLPKPEKALVIEGAIENGGYPWVKITRNTPYFELLDSATLFNVLIVSNAIVTVSDGVITEKLNPVFDLNVVPPLVYKGKTMKGEVGKTYYLKVYVDGKVFTAQTVIPKPVLLDSLRFKLRYPEKNDSLGFLWIYFKDPDTTGNYYRVFTKTIGKDSVFVHPFASVADDKLINGIKVQYAVNRGRNPNVQSDSGEPNPDATPFWAFVKGEKAIMKFCSIDMVHFNFWHSVEQQMSSDGNPFASPASVITNIEGGALGIWGGYGVFLDTIDIPKY